MLTLLDKDHNQTLRHWLKKDKPAAIRYILSFFAPELELSTEPDLALSISKPVQENLMDHFILPLIREHPEIGPYFILLLEESDTKKLDLPDELDTYVEKASEIFEQYTDQSEADTDTFNTAIERIEKLINAKKEHTPEHALAEKGLNYVIKRMTLRDNTMTAQGLADTFCALACGASIPSKNNGSYTAPNILEFKPRQI